MAFRSDKEILVMGEERERNKDKARTTNTSPSVLRGRKKGKTLPRVSKEDVIKWLQEVKISELHRYR
jgi:hypothetical protein